MNTEQQAGKKTTLPRKRKGVRMGKRARHKHQQTLDAEQKLLRAIFGPGYKARPR